MIDLNYDLLTWLVQQMPNQFVNGEITDNVQVAGKAHLFAEFSDDSPADMGVLSCQEDQNSLDFVPVRNATCQLLLRMANSATESGRTRVKTLAKLVDEMLKTTKLQAKTHVTLPSGRVVLIFREPRTLPGGMDSSGRFRTLVEFKLDYRDALS